MSKVMVYPATYGSLREAVKKAFAIFPLDLCRKKVLIKPNLLRGFQAKV